MAFYRIDRPAYFDTRLKAESPANTIHVNSDWHRDDYLVRLAHCGCTEFTVTELTRDEYLAVAKAKLPRLKP